MALGGFFDVNVRGVRHVRREIGEKLHELQDRTEVGVWEAGLKVQRAAQQKTPVVTGHLKSSAYTNAWKHHLGPAVEIGYTAVYAAMVHQSRNAGQLGHLNPPDGPQIYSYVGEPLFLDNAVDEKQDDILLTIWKRARL